MERRTQREGVPPPTLKHHCGGAGAAGPREGGAGGTRPRIIASAAPKGRRLPLHGNNERTDAQATRSGSSAPDKTRAGADDRLRGRALFVDVFQALSSVTYLRMIQVGEAGL